MTNAEEPCRAYFAVAPTRSQPLWTVTRGRGGPVVARSRTGPCAELAASRLYGGEPVETPDGATRRCLWLYGRAFPDIFSLYVRRYLLPGEWLLGGVTDGDVTGISILGRRQEREARRAERERMGEEMGWPGLPPLPEIERWSEEQGRSYGWPVASGECRLPHGTPRCAAERLTAMPTRDVDPEWLEDARNGVMLLIRHAAGAGGSDVASLRDLARRLAAAHGGRWEP